MSVSNRIDGLQDQLWSLERQRKSGLYDTVLESRIQAVQHQLAALRSESTASLREQLPMPSSQKNRLNG